MAALPESLVPDAYVVDTPEKLQRVIATYSQRDLPIFADTETTGLDERTNKLVAVQMWQDVGMPAIIDARVVDVTPLNELAHLTWTFHNGQFDLGFLRANGVFIERVWDTLVAEQIIYGGGNDENQETVNYHLKDLAWRYCAFEMPKEARSWFIDLDTRPMEWNAAFPAEQCTYMTNDVLYLPTIARKQAAKLRQLGMREVAKLEMRVVPALSWMRSDGVLVDTEQWRAVIREKEAEVLRLENELLVSDLALAILAVRTRRYQEALDANERWKAAVKEAEADAKRLWEQDNEQLMWGEYKKRYMTGWRANNVALQAPKPSTSLLEVNLSSSQQIKDGLAELGIALENTEAETLERASTQFPVLNPLLAFRRAQKFVSTYGEELLAKIGSDGRIHPEYNQIVSTGRMSCRNPNWQNIPARTADGKRLRQAVIAAPGWKLLVADMPNAEMRIIADMSGCKPMLEMFASGVDMHTFTARRMFKLPDEMTDDEVKEYRLPDGPLKGLKARDIAKTINFGTAYGQGEVGFAAKFSVTKEEAAEFRALWNAAFDGLADWFSMQADTGLRLGYSVTMMGRRRNYTIPERPRGKYDYDKPEWRLYGSQRGSIKRASMNHPIQGTNADMTKFAVAEIHEYIVNNDKRWKMVAVVHDEIVLEVPDSETVEARVVQGRAMWNAMRRFLKRVDIPVIVPHVGECWEH